jgi:hypothetical protein
MSVQLPTTYTKDTLCTSSLNTYLEANKPTIGPAVQLHEQSLLKKLADSDPASFTDDSFSVKTDMSTLLKNEVMLDGTLADSNCAMSLEFISGTNMSGASFIGSISDMTLTAGSITGQIQEGQLLVGSGIKPNTIIGSGSGSSWALNKSHSITTAISMSTYVANSAYDELQLNSDLQTFSNRVVLGDDTAPLYNSRWYLEYYKPTSDNTYTDASGNFLQLDNSDASYNLHTAVNSSLSNLNVNSANGIRVEYDNTFNATHAFLTDKILTRDSSNIISVLTDENGDEVSLSPNDNMLHPSLDNWEYTIDVSSNSMARYGSLKFAQEMFNATISYNALDDSMKYTTTTTDLSGNTTIASTGLPTTITEDQFKSMFSAIISSIVPGTFSLNIQVSVSDTDGYNIPNTDTSDSTLISVFECNNDNLIPNLSYMDLMRSTPDFKTTHKLIVENGNLEFNSSDNSFQDASDNYITILDGTELISNPLLLSNAGQIITYNSNNTKNNTDCRYSMSSSLDETAEVDYTSLHVSLKENYTVESNLTILAESTLDVDSLSVWNSSNSEIVAASGSDTVMTFQSNSNSTLYNSSNISSYDASGMSALKTASDEFMFIQINKTLTFGNDSDESAMIKTSDNTAIGGVVSNVSVTNIDLNQLNAQDLRVKIYGKKISDLPFVTQPNWSLRAGNQNYSLGASNDNADYLIAEKTGTDLFGPYIYDIMKLGPNAEILITPKISVTNSAPSKDVLYRTAQITVNIPLSSPVAFTTNISADDNDFKLSNIVTSTSLGVEMNLDNYRLVGGGIIPSYYKVKKYITTQTYNASIRLQLGSYQNLWCQRDNITEITEWYALENSNKNNAVMPDSYLIKIVDSNNLQAFVPKRYFDGNVNELSFSINLKPKDLMGFKAKAEYQTSSGWVEFSMETDSDYNYSIDMGYDKSTVLHLFTMISSTKITCDMTIDIDCPMDSKFGLLSHISTPEDPDPVMYIINLSIARGVNSFAATGYKYNVETHAQHFPSGWSYQSDTNLFLKDSDDVLVGTEISNLNTLVELLPPSAGDVNSIKLTLKQNTSTVLSFVSDKYILENFNVLFIGGMILKHVYKVGNDTTDALTPITEYLLSQNDSVSNSNLVNLKYGLSSASGVKYIIDNTNYSVGTVTMILNPDYVQAKPSITLYNGDYSTKSRFMINKLQTNSTFLRNIQFRHYRGYEYHIINIVRTASTVKFLAGLIDSNTSVDTPYLFDPLSSVLGAGSTPMYATSILELNNIQYGTNGNSNLLSNTYVPTSTTLIGNVGLSINCGFSMLSGSSGTRSFLMNINSPTVTVTIENNSRLVGIENLNSGLQTSNNEGPYSYSMTTSLDETNLNLGPNTKISSARVMSYELIDYTLEYNAAGLLIYSSPTYIGDPATFPSSDWTLIGTFDTEMLQNGFEYGITTFKLKPDTAFSSSFVKYAICPRPIAIAYAYDINDLSNLSNALPFDYGTLLTRRSYGIDIVLESSSGAYLPPNAQSNRPFPRLAPSPNPNSINAFPSGSGLNDLIIGFNVSKYSNLISAQDPFSFELKTNKLKITDTMGGTSITSSSVVLFDEYISKLYDNSNWHSSVKSVANLFRNGKWELNVYQPDGPINNSGVTYGDNVKNIYLNGITPFGMNYTGLPAYLIEFKLMDSVKFSLYTMEQSYDTTAKQHSVTFNRFSSANRIPWTDADGFVMSSCFKPLLIKCEKTTVNINIPNVLPDTGTYNVVNLVKNAVNQNTSWTNWSEDLTYTSASCPYRFVTMSTNGAREFHKMLYVTKEVPYKIFTSTRPNIMTVVGLDGGSKLTINNDGMLICPIIIWKESRIVGTQNYSSGKLPNLSQEYFEGNIIV